VTVSCRSNPERTTITNIGARSVTITRVGSIILPRSNEPYSVTKTLQPGKSVTYQTGGAASSNVLTQQYIYDDDVKTAEGANVRISSGKFFSDRC
jgi:hypothetical protein